MLPVNYLMTTFEFPHNFPDTFTRFNLSIELNPLTLLVVCVFIVQSKITLIQCLAKILSRPKYLSYSINNVVNYINNFITQIPLKKVLFYPENLSG